MGPWEIGRREEVAKTHPRQLEQRQGQRVGTARPAAGPRDRAAGPFTVVNAKHQRVAMHAVRLRLLELQAEAVGLPLRTIEIPHPCSDEQYQSAMRPFIGQSRSQGVQCMAFGDLFLQDIREYREKQLNGTGIVPRFPLWNKPTRAWPTKCWQPDCGRSSSAWTRAGCPAATLAVNGPKRCSTNCRPRSIRAARTASFTRWRSMARCSSGRCAFEIGETVEREGFFFADVLPIEAD